jgi:pimeloyl-ACP methyl ester carboxylesterase
LNVTDDFCPGDQFRVYDFGAPIGDTPPVAISYSCPELGPAAASVNPAYSHRTFLLGPGNHSITIQTITNPFGGGRAYLRVDSFSGTVDLLDPIASSPSLLSGNNIISDSNNAAFISPGIITRIGVAADGVAKLVLRFNAPDAGTVTFSLVDDSGYTLLNSPANGFLTNLQGGPVLTVPTNSTHEAFAIYTAPTDFSDDSGIFHSVYVQTTFFPAAGGMITEPLTTIRIVRPLVWLVHGIWSCNTSWHTGAFSTLTNDPRFTVATADYRDDPGGPCMASKHFATSAPTVYGQLVSALAAFRQTNSVAAVQADVVTHSMGGPVVRTMALQPNFLTDPSFPTFGSGPIHKLITIAGVHLGTPFAPFILSSSCYTSLFNNHFGRPTGNGAVSDLDPNSTAISNINKQHTPFPAHTIVGLADTAQKLANSIEINLGLSFLPASLGTPACWITIFPGFDSILGGTNDLLVPSNSQSANGAVPSSSPFNDTIHSGWPLQPVTGTFELGSTDIVAEIITLLNQNANDAIVFKAF